MAKKTRSFVKVAPEALWLRLIAEQPAAPALPEADAPACPECGEPTYREADGDRVCACGWYEITGLDDVAAPAPFALPSAPGRYCPIALLFDEAVAA